MCFNYFIGLSLSPVFLQTKKNHHSVYIPINLSYRQYKYLLNFYEEMWLYLVLNTDYQTLFLIYYQYNFMMDTHAEIRTLLPILLKIWRLTGKLNILECHHLQNDRCHKNNLNQTFEILLFFLDPLLILILLLVLLSSRLN